jgi:hypothetical protein
VATEAMTEHHHPADAFQVATVDFAADIMTMFIDFKITVHCISFPLLFMLLCHLHEHSDRTAIVHSCSPPYFISGSL